MKPFEINGVILARNSLINLIGQAVPLLLGVVTIPFVVRGFGAERFGLFSLTWVVLGYFTIFDFGIARATTKFLAEAMGRHETENLHRLVWTSLATQVVLGVIGGIVTILAIPLLVGKLLNISPALAHEAKSVFLLVGLSLPVILGSGTFQGVLSAAQRFDLINAVRVPSNCLTYLLPAVGVFLHLSLHTIVLMLLLVRLGVGVTYLVIYFNVFSIWNRGVSFDRSMIRPLFTYGGWVTVSGVLGPVLVYLDRFLIGSFLTVAAVTYYVAPYEVVTRLWILPTCMMMSIFPASSALWGRGAAWELGELYTRAVKYLVLTVGPLSVFLVLFAPEILDVWLGPEFAQRSTGVFQILAMGVLINSLAQVPYSFLQGINRPDLPSKFYLLEIPVYGVLAYFLIKNAGVTGAAVAWSLRVSLDASLLFGTIWKTGLISHRSWIENRVLRSFLIFLGLFVGVMLSVFFIFPLSSRILVTIFTGGLFGMVTWHCALNHRDKGLLSSLFRRSSLKCHESRNVA